MDIKTISLALVYAAIVSTLIPFVSGLINFDSRPLYLKLLCCLMGVSFLTDFANYFLHWNALGNIYRLFEFLILFMIFYLALNVRRWRAIFLTGAILYVVFFAVNLVFLQKNKTHSNTPVISSLIFIGLSIVFFYRLMKEMPTRKLSQLPMFWISIGVLFYFSGNFFLFPVYDYVARDPDPRDFDKLYLYWSFHNVFSITSYFLYAAAFWKTHESSAVAET